MTQEGLRLETGLWLDQHDAEARVAAREADGHLTPEEAERLTRFARDGYLIVDLEVPEQTLDGLVRGIDRLWQQGPEDLAFAYDSPPRRMSEADEARHRHPRYRIHDVHSHLPEALDLYLHARLFRWTGLILDEEPVAIQSLLFEYGSQQALHRDTVVVPTRATGHLLASWIALEDIHPESGALVYVPGSHRLPYYEFRPGQYEFDGATMGDEEIRAATAFDDEQCRNHGLEPQLFTARKGQALIWHASLRHGGGPVGDPVRTRRSFVVHYSTLSTYRTRSITLHERTWLGNRRKVRKTRKLLERAGHHGFDNPLRG